MAGEVRIGDRNYATAPSLRRFRQESRQQRRFHRPGALAGLQPEPAGRTDFDLIDHLGTLPNDMAPHEVTVRGQGRPSGPPLPLRLIIQRKTPEATEATRKKLHREASRKQKTLDPRSLVAAEFMILATSLPGQAIRPREVLAVYRLRWQIELAFKRLKSLLHIESCRHGPRKRREVGSTPISSWPCCATISARNSWNFPLRTCSTQAYIPSLWRSQHTISRWLVGAVIGPHHARRLAATPIQRASPPRQLQTKTKTAHPLPCAALI